MAEIGACAPPLTDQQRANRTGKEAGYQLRAKDLLASTRVAVLKKKFRHSAGGDLLKEENLEPSNNEQSYVFDAHLLIYLAINGHKGSSIPLLEQGILLPHSRGL